ncbi:MAG TPA: hypothetical protein VFJ74_09000 [Gemmatimonadaceae bacterium]|nr:hypothetical protein [Gemmatimonadaceae bacterium]
MRARGRVGLIAATSALLVAAACSDVITDPSTPVAIAFDSLAAPSIVVGDTLRDPITGAVAPLTAQAFNSRGDTISNAPFTFFPRDTGGALQVVGGNLLYAAKLQATNPGVVASLNGLQLTRTIAIVLRPDALHRTNDSVPTIGLVGTDDVGNVSKDSLRVRVVHDTSTADSTVRSWLVFFSVVDSAPAIADSVRLINGQGNRSTVDTTDAAGLASRQVRVYAKAGTLVGTTDSVIVQASAKYRGAELRGSPVTFAVPLVVTSSTASSAGRRASATTSSDALPAAATAP